MARQSTAGQLRGILVGIPAFTRAGRGALILCGIGRPLLCLHAAGPTVWCIYLTPLLAFGVRCVVYVQSSLPGMLDKTRQNSQI